MAICAIKKSETGYGEQRLEWGAQGLVFHIGCSGDHWGRDPKDMRE